MDKSRSDLVNRISHYCIRLRGNRLQTLRDCQAIVPSYVGDPRPDRHLKHWHSKDRADGGDGTADDQA